MQILLLRDIGIGNVDEVLNKTLLHNYLQAFTANLSLKLEAICLYSQGVKLACTNGVTLEQLQILEAQGTKILVCKTCINYFKLEEQLKVGELSTMPAILALQAQASKIFMI